MKLAIQITIAVALFFACYFVTGCAPDELKTTMHINPVTGSMDWLNHKDTTATDVTIAKTNNNVLVHIGSITTANNPAAINAQANLNQVTITAYGDSGTKIANAIAGALGTTGGAAIGAAVKTP